MGTCSDSLEEVGWWHWSTFCSWYITKWNGGGATISSFSSNNKTELCSAVWYRRNWDHSADRRVSFFIVARFSGIFKWRRGSSERRRKRRQTNYICYPPLSSSYGSCQDERGIYSLAFSLSGSRVVGLQQAHSILSTTICLWFHHTINKGTTVVCVSIQGSPEKRQWGRASWDYCRRRL